ncbi:MAG TPA: hypothetical protein VJ508_06335, partial [Saprospiraceae bacterium]|nr:hypothetical protein [Saprospiraceae bacterium]
MALRLMAATAMVCLLYACNSKKYLQEGQSFLYANKTSIKSHAKIPNKSDLYDDLVTLYRQPETKTVFGIPRHVFYYHYIESLKRRPGRKQWSEERLIKNRPVIFDSLKAEQTAQDFKHYLALRGYRFAKASFKAKVADKEANVFYKVDPGPRMYVDSFQIIAEDYAIQHLIDSVPSPGIIKKGSPLDIELFNQEKARIVRLIQNRGYATFDETYIPQLEVDTSMHRVKATMRVLNPSDSTYHLIYRIGTVTIYPDYDATISRTFFDTIVNKLHYELPDSAVFTLKPEALQRNVYLQPGALSRRDDLDRTVRSLSRMDLIKFVTPAFYVDTSDATLPRINYTFFL